VGFIDVKAKIMKTYFKLPKQKENYLSSLQRERNRKEHYSISKKN
jgi:hypothetical protein